MTAMQTDDLAVITGTPFFTTDTGNVFESNLLLGEVVRIVDHADSAGDVWAEGLESGRHDYIALSSLTPLSELHGAPDVKWGDLLDPDYVHDYVWEGEE